tara:strand:- start:3905 stop:4684 length:780 start_codon:yes stop_codon:yes gene_type:complete
MKTLADIIKFKKEEIILKKSALSLETMKQKFDCDFSIRPFVKKIEENKSAISIISEIKKASPSKGIIRSDFNPIEIGKIYEKNGATCLSILTDKKFFQGDDNFIKAVKREVSLPILRKDFIIDEWQIEESRYIGADCILLILSCLSFNQAKEYEDYAHKLGMSVIVEVHDLNELELANKLNSKLIGINNRNLKTMEVDINTSIKLIKNLDNGKIPISESGISSSKDLNKLRDAGFNTFLIGEAFMKENNITKMFESLKN